MTTPEEDADWFSKVADVFALIPDIYRVYGVKGDDSDPKVVPMSDELPVGSVIGVLGYDGGTIIPGSWERQEHSLDAAIWIPAPAGTLDKAYTLAVAYVDRVMSIFPGHGQAGGVGVSGIQSVLVTEFDQVESRIWADKEGERTYVVLPFTLEVTRSRARAYVAA